ncbi:MAG: aminotransferase class IV, partial [Acidobacteriota bacterium]
GRPFRLEAHLDRLAASVRTLGLPAPGSGWRAEVAAAIADLAGRLSTGRARARVTLTAGDASPDADPAAPPAGPPRLWVRVTPYGGPDGAARRSGISATLPEGDDARAAPARRHKTLAVDASLRVLRAAHAAGYDEGLLATGRGRLLGGTRSNLFLVVDGVIWTPDLDSGCLPGIIRHLVLDELAPAVGATAQERTLAPGDLERAAEAFVSNSLAGILPLARIGSRALSSARKGSVTSCIMESYNSVVAAECGPG